MSIAALMSPRSASVAAALRARGLRNAGTPLLMASTPVSATAPEANARATRNAPATPTRPCSNPAAGTTSYAALSASGRVPERYRTAPTTASSPMMPMKQYTRTAKTRPDSRTPRRLNSVTTSTSATATTVSLPRSAGTTVAPYWAAEEIETATVST